MEWRIFRHIVDFAALDMDALAEWTEYPPLEADGYGPTVIDIGQAYGAGSYICVATRGYREVIVAEQKTWVAVEHVRDPVE